MHPDFTEICSTILFFIAIIHACLINKFRMIANRYTPKTKSYILWYLFSELELVFGFWSFVFLAIFTFSSGIHPTIGYLKSLDFSGPIFIFMIMCVSATRPIIVFAEKMIAFGTKLLPLSFGLSFYMTTMIIGPLLGSFITEPAAMTITAFVLLNSLYERNISDHLKYATIALLFVNVSIGGTLSHFAAPPVLMVASKWQWGTSFMLMNFGYKAVLAIIFSTVVYASYFRKELNAIIPSKDFRNDEFVIQHLWISIGHILFLIFIILTFHRPVLFLGVCFLFFIFFYLTKKHQENLKIKDSFMVSFFLAGIICLGTLQTWWLRPLLFQMGEYALFFSSAILTSFIDNAVITYLGSMLNLSITSKYLLVSGAVVGGGLTVIGNAPNPSGFRILHNSFGKDGINQFKLFLWALPPTFIAILSFLLL